MLISNSFVSNKVESDEVWIRRGFMLFKYMS
jgi:hypothetical protein